MTPRPGDFGLAPGTGVAGFIIRLGTFSRYGHAVVATSTNPLLIVEAMPDGARQRPADPGEFVWSRCPLGDAQRQRIVGDARACIGLPYDWRDIAGFVLRFFGAKVRGKSADHADDRLICSELVAWAYRQAGHEVARSAQVAAGDCSPGDLGQHITEEAPP